MKWSSIVSTTLVLSKSVFAETTGSATLNFSNCNGCEELYSDIEYDWQTCFEAGVAVEISDDFLTVDLDDNACGSFDQVDLIYTPFTEHSISAIVEYPTTKRGLRVDNSYYYGYYNYYNYYSSWGRNFYNWYNYGYYYNYYSTTGSTGITMHILVTGNAEDGTVQLAYSIPDFGLLLLNFEIDTIDGTFLGFDSIPNLASPTISDGSITLKLTDYDDDDDGDDFDYCEAVLDSTCDATVEALKEGEWKVSVETVVIDDDEHYHTLSMDLASCEVNNAPVFDTIWYINGAAIIGYVDESIFIMLNERSKESVSAIWLDWQGSASSFCNMHLDVTASDGGFLGFSTSSSTTTNSVQTRRRRSSTTSTEPTTDTSQGRRRSSTTSTEPTSTTSQGRRTRFAETAGIITRPSRTTTSTTDEVRAPSKTTTAKDRDSYKATTTTKAAPTTQQEADDYACSLCSLCDLASIDCQEVAQIDCSQCSTAECTWWVCF
jgi:hypothetical protein